MLFSVLNVFVSIDMVSACASACASAITDRTQVDKKSLACTCTQQFGVVIWYKFSTKNSSVFFSLLLLLVIRLITSLLIFISTVCGMPMPNCSTYFFFTLVIDI